MFFVLFDFCTQIKENSGHTKMEARIGQGEHIDKQGHVFCRAIMILQFHC